jgi:hypothetical protein
VHTSIYSLFCWGRVTEEGQHGSDSGTYDKEGRFVPQMFEDLFAKWDVHGAGSLSAGELWHMIKGHRLAADPFGWGAAIFEFGTTWLLLQKDGRVSKEDLRQTYDVSWLIARWSWIRVDNTGDNLLENQGS